MQKKVIAWRLQLRQWVVRLQYVYTLYFLILGSHEPGVTQLSHSKRFTRFVFFNEFSSVTERSRHLLVAHMKHGSSAKRRSQQVSPRSILQRMHAVCGRNLKPSDDYVLKKTTK